MSKYEEILSEFLDTDTLKAVPSFLNSDSDFSSADLIASTFGADAGFTKKSDDEVSKLIVSFKNNLTLLIQKTWVEKSDIALKDQLLYQLEHFLKDDKSWKNNYSMFLNLINQAVYLMFGQSTDTPDFAEYAIRIDPEFGIFWWYISNLPPESSWSEEKCRIAIMVGMYFLANY